MAKHNEVKVGEVWTMKIGARKKAPVRILSETAPTTRWCPRTHRDVMVGRKGWRVLSLEGRKEEKNITAAKLRLHIRNADGTVSASEATRRMERLELARAAMTTRASHFPQGEPDGQASSDRNGQQRGW